MYVYAFLSTINDTRKIIFLIHLPYTSYFTYITKRIFLNYFTKVIYYF